MKTAQRATFALFMAAALAVANAVLLTVRGWIWIADRRRF